MFLYIAITGVVILGIKFLLTTDPKPILGVYSQCGKWFFIKFWFFFGLLKLRQYQNKRKKNVSDGSAGYGMRSRSSLEEMDRPQKLPIEHPKAVDAVYFNGSNKDGYYMVGATARRHEGLIQTLLYIRIPGLGLLELPSLPDTSLYTKEEMAYSVDGFTISVVEPMKKWKLTYSGKMRLLKEREEKQEEVLVKFDIDWTATSRFFDFDTDLNTYAMCDAMAREPWSREFFKKLQDAHQTHHEQFGEMKGPIEIEGHGQQILTIQGVRDHSYGNIRDWKELHRYAIQYIYLEDGTSICIGNVCMAVSLTRLIIGYVMDPNGAMDTISWSDLYLHNMGEDGNDPKDYEINFVAGDKNYKVEGHVVECPIFYMGLEWDARIHERMCTYRVNSIPGWGISEWDYRNHTGKPEIYNRKTKAPSTSN